MFLSSFSTINIFFLSSHPFTSSTTILLGIKLLVILSVLIDNPFGVILFISLRSKGVEKTDGFCEDDVIGEEEEDDKLF
jgi:hypothetical protein